MRLAASTQAGWCLLASLKHMRSCVFSQSEPAVHGSPHQRVDGICLHSIKINLAWLQTAGFAADRHCVARPPVQDAPGRDAGGHGRWRRAPQRVLRHLRLHGRPAESVGDHALVEVASPCWLNGFPSQSMVIQKPTDKQALSLATLAVQNDGSGAGCMQKGHSCYASSMLGPVHTSAMHSLGTHSICVLLLRCVKQGRTAGITRGYQRPASFMLKGVVGSRL